jgi:hypothetical protein
VNKKTLMTAGLVVAVTGIITAGAGCSDDESTGSSSSAFSCPAVGSKACPNDEAVTQASYDACKKCESQGAAYAKCSGASTTPKCGADGKSESQQADTSKCQSELAEVVKCALGGAGTPDGG